jgi:hypothetical protein
VRVLLSTVCKPTFSAFSASKSRSALLTGSTSLRTAALMVSSSLILLMASSSILRSDSFSPPNWAPSAENDFSSGSIGFSLADMGSDGVSAGLALRGRKPNRLMAAILWCADSPGRCDAESPCA